MEALKNQHSETSKGRSSPEKNLSENDGELKKISIIPEDGNEDLHLLGLKVQLGDDEAYSFAIEQPDSQSADVSTIPAGAIRLRERQMYHGQDIADIDSVPHFQNQATNTVKVDSEGLQAIPAIEMKFSPSCAEINDLEIRIRSKSKSGSESTSVEEKQASCIHCGAEDQLVCVTERNATKGSSSSVTYLKVSPTARLKSVTELSSTGTQTQTERVEDTAVATDRDISIVEREDMRDKSVDTEDLVFVPPMLAKAERAEAEEERCRCPCVPPVRHDYICRCSYHREHENICPESVLYQFPHSVSQIIVCPLERNYCENTDKCAEKPKNNVLKSCCCKSERNTKNGSKMPEEDLAVEKFETPTTICVDAHRKLNSALREKNSDKSQLEIAKRLKFDLKNATVITAVKVIKTSKVENVSDLCVPLFIEHYLTSFSMSILRASRVAVNPLSITFQKARKTVPKNTDDAHQKMRSVPDRQLNDKSKSTLLLLSDQSKSKPVVVSYIPPPQSTVQDMAHSQVCLCSECYWSVQTAVQRRENRLPQSSALGKAEAEKRTSPSHQQPRSTSPKIQHKTFDYTSKDAWKPHRQRSGEFLCRDTDGTDIISVGYSSSEESSEECASTIGINDACEAVNNHLLSLRPVDEDTVHEAAKLLHRLWFETAGKKCSDVREVRHCMEYFEEFSNNLLKTLLHSVDNNGNNVFHFAFANNRFDLVEEILRKGFTKELLNKRNKNGNSPLLICSISRPKSPSDWLTIRKCFEMGDVNAKAAKSGQTPLMNAASSGFHEMVDVLLEAGADPNLQDKDGSTALMYAAEHGHGRCVRSLMVHERCNPTIRDKDGQTACSIALDSGFKNIAVLIHMQALENRRLTQKVHSSKRHVWTNVDYRARKRALSMMPRSNTWESHENLHI